MLRAIPIPISKEREFEALTQSFMKSRASQEGSAHPQMKDKFRGTIQNFNQTGSRWGDGNASNANSRNMEKHLSHRMHLPDTQNMRTLHPTDEVDSAVWSVGKRNR